MCVSFVYRGRGNVYTETLMDAIAQINERSCFLLREFANCPIPGAPCKDWGLVFKSNDIRLEVS